MPSPVRTSCWCGETGGPEIGPDYRRCARCGTVVVSTLPAGPHGDSRRDNGLYGRRYWRAHLVDPLDTVRRDEFERLRSRLEPIEPTSAPEP